MWDFIVIGKEENTIINVNLSTIYFEDVQDMEHKGEFKNKVPCLTVTLLKDGYIFDEEQSVKWNREQVEAHNTDIKRQKDDYSSGEMKAHAFFADCLKAAITHETGLTLEKAEVIYQKAYADGHSGGYQNVIAYASELCDFVSDILR